MNYSKKRVMSVPGISFLLGISSLESLRGDSSSKKFTRRRCRKGSRNFISSRFYKPPLEIFRGTSQTPRPSSYYGFPDNSTQTQEDDDDEYNHHHHHQGGYHRGYEDDDDVVDDDDGDEGFVKGSNQHHDAAVTADPDEDTQCSPDIDDLLDAADNEEELKRVSNTDVDEVLRKLEESLARLNNKTLSNNNAQQD